jgi:hypothetical protein
VAPWVDKNSGSAASACVSGEGRGVKKGGSFFRVKRDKKIGFFNKCKSNVSSVSLAEKSPKCRGQLMVKRFFRISVCGQ